LQGPLTTRPVLDELLKNSWEGRPFRGTAINYRKDGVSFEMEWHISPIRAADGTVSQYLSIQRDVTAIKQFQCRGARQNQPARGASKPANVLTHSIPHPFRPLQLFLELSVPAQAV
jgi:hypothetical protein